MLKSISPRLRRTKSILGDQGSWRSRYKRILSYFREMRAQGEDLRKEMFAQEERQRAAMDDLMEAIDVRAQLAELGEDVR